MKTTSYEVHHHTFIRGPRNRPAYGKNGNYIGQSRVKHSHAGGGIPHTHPDSRPSRSPVRRGGFAAEKLIDRACTAVLIIAALYLAGHIIAAWLRGSFDAVIHKSLEAIR